MGKVILNQSNISLTLHNKMKFPIKDIFSKFDQVHSFLRIWSHLLKKSLMENIIFCTVYLSNYDIEIKNALVGPLQPLSRYNKKQRFNLFPYHQMLIQNPRMKRFGKKVSHCTVAQQSVINRV